MGAPSKACVPVARLTPATFREALRLLRSMIGPSCGGLRAEIVAERRERGAPNSNRRAATCRAPLGHSYASPACSRVPLRVGWPAMTRTTAGRSALLFIFITVLVDSIGLGLIL